MTKYARLFASSVILACVASHTVVDAAPQASARPDTAEPGAVRPDSRHFRLSEVDGDVAIVQWDRQAIRNAAQRGTRFSVSQFPLLADRLVNLDLQPFHVAGADTQFVVGRRGQPDRPLAFDATSIMLFRGEVTAMAGSHVFLAFGENFATGYVDLGPGRARYQISMKDRQGQPLEAGHISVFEPVNATNLPPGVPFCGVEGDHFLRGTGARGMELPVIDDTSARAATSTVGLKHLELAVDTDYDYFILFGDEIEATAYLIAMYGAVSDIYMRDVNTRIEIVFARIETDPNDRYNGPNPLMEFYLDWEANMGFVQRDAAQFFSGRRDFPFGGQAFLSQLCNFAYGVVGYAVGFFPDPSRPSPFNWDVSVTAHEIGHNAGTGHTHDDSNLAPNFIDTCDDPNSTPQRGTIMSYCGQTWSGMNANTDNYFHTRIQVFIENHVNSRSCIVDDCNMNDISDSDDISMGTSNDANLNGIPDECEDCNENLILDPADIFNGTSDDDNGNGIPDECEPDCNANGIPDDKDIADGTSDDAYGNGIPDECEEDCNNNGTADYNEIQANMPLDVDRNAVLDSCQDCDNDLISDHNELDAAHYLWVTSGLSGSIIREFFPTTGVLTRASGGIGVAQVNQGQDLIVTSDGRTLVTSAGDDRVMRFSSAGLYVGDFVSSGSGGLNHPTGLIMTPDGTLLVSSRDTDSVLAYDGITGASLGAFVAAGAGGLTAPFGLTLGPNGNLFVTSASNEIIEYDGNSGSLVGVMVSASANGGLDQPRGLTFKPDGNLLVASYGTDEVLEFNGKTGAPLGKWAHVGTETRITQDSPWGIRIGPNGHVFVARTGSDFSSRTVGGNGDVEESHLTDARMFEYNVCNGDFRKTHIGGNDHGLNFATGFDFVPGFAIDCNQNQLQDSCDVSSGFSADDNGNGIPDECEVDCNNNGTQDRLDLIPFGASFDCNCNFQPDECDISSGASLDCDANGVPDECEDCNANGIGDACDISGGASDDCNNNGTPDECESSVDCNNNGAADICDLADGTSLDCNGNKIPDSCDTSGGGLLLEVDFESGLPPGWTTTGLFQVTSACPVNPVCDGSQWAYAGNTGSCNHGNNQAGELISPPIALAATTTTLSFCSMVDTEAGFDFVQVIVNGDVVYQDSGEFGVWEEQVIDLTAYGGQIITITFRFASDGFVTAFGWQVDHIRLSNGSGDCDGNGVPDECEPDCNANGNPDACDIADGSSDDLNGNDIPDECEGACCLGDASCIEEESEISCSELGGLFQGVGIACSATNCVAFGVCCLPNDVCQSQTTQAECAALPGEYLGNDTTCQPGTCVVVNPPLAAPAPHDRKKNRYISFVPNNTEPVAFQVTMTSSLFHPDALGQSAWVDVPDPITGMSALTTGPVRRVWNEPVVHAGGCLVSPVASYDVLATATGGSPFTAPLSVPTIDQPGGSRWWGDTVGFFNGIEWTPPQGTTNIDDVVAVIKTWQVKPGAPHDSVTDVEPRVLNKAVNFNDVLFIILAFQGDFYPFGCPADPCQDNMATPCP